MQELKDRYIRFDWAIKRLLRQKANFGVLEGFLTVFLNEPIKIIDILESEGRAEGRAESKTEGKTKAKNSIALKMMKGGMPIEQIMQFTGLSEKEIKSL